MCGVGELSIADAEFRYCTSIFGMRDAVLARLLEAETDDIHLRDDHFGAEAAIHCTAATSQSYVG